MDRQAPYQAKSGLQRAVHLHKPRGAFPNTHRAPVHVVKTRIP